MYHKKNCLSLFVLLVYSCPFSSSNLIIQLSPFPTRFLSHCSAFLPIKSFSIEFLSKYLLRMYACRCLIKLTWMISFEYIFYDITSCALSMWTQRRFLAYEILEQEKDWIHVFYHFKVAYECCFCWSLGNLTSALNLTLLPPLFVWETEETHVFPKFVLNGIKDIKIINISW